MILAPEAHFFMGGVVVDEWAESSVRGLFVVGEAAGGVHGANRLDSNAIPETQVFGARAGKAAAARSVASGRAVPSPPQTADGPTDFGKRNPHPRQRLLRTPSNGRCSRPTMSRTFGIVRSCDQMEQGLIEVEALQHTLDATTPAGVRELMLHLQMANSLLVARACLGAGLMREESRGAHYRQDFPHENDAQWKCSLQIDLIDGDLQLRRCELEAVR